MQQIFRQWIGMHRAMTAWFHAAHHVTKGTGFGGDHVNLYGEIYTQLDEDLDAIVEKGIGLTGDETLADPVSSLSMAAGLLAQQPATANQDAETIACNAFEVIKYYVKAIESIYSQFDSCGMSLGLDDLIQGYANQYETYVYLLQQRSRTVSLNKSPIIAMQLGETKMNKRRLRRILRRVIRESMDVEANRVSRIGYGTMNTLADLSDHVMNLARDGQWSPDMTEELAQDAKDLGYDPIEVDAFFQDRLGRNQGVTNAVAAGELESRRRR